MYQLLLPAVLAKYKIYDVFQQAEVDGALAASVFHYGELTIPEVNKD